MTDLPRGEQQLVDIITDRVVARLREGEGVRLPCECPPEPAAVAHLQDLVRNGACRVACDVRAASMPPDLASAIDHTLLRPDATEAEIQTLCEEARNHRFASVCVNPTWVPLCARLLAGASVEVCTVIGFPLGASATEAKAFETSTAVAQGATEVDMVLNVGALRSGHYGRVLRDIREVVRAAGDRACVKVILETALLTDEEKVAACALARDAGAHYVKTSTGFGGGGATVEDVRLMRRAVGPTMGVKASGGVRDRATATAMLAAGANRIGASAGIKIVQGDAAPAGKGY